MFCRNCGAQLQDGTVICPSCGAYQQPNQQQEFQQYQQPRYQQSQYQQPQQTYYSQTQPAQGNGYSTNCIVGFVLSCAAVLFMFIASFIGFGLAVAGIIVSAVALEKLGNRAQRVKAWR